MPVFCVRRRVRARSLLCRRYRWRWPAVCRRGLNVAALGARTGLGSAATACGPQVPQPPRAAVADARQQFAAGLNATSETRAGSAGRMPSCCWAASMAVMAEPAWPVGKTRQAATASLRAYHRVLLGFDHIVLLRAYYDVLFAIATVFTLAGIATNML